MKLIARPESPLIPTAPPAAPEFALSRARGDLLVLTYIYTATLVLGVGALFGLLQAFSRANWIAMPAWFDYYRMLTAHGVMMALVFTTFFIVGLFTYCTYTAIPRERTYRLNWTGYCVMLLGTVMATIAILDGSASVLYTFLCAAQSKPAVLFRRDVAYRRNVVRRGRHYRQCSLVSTPQSGRQHSAAGVHGIDDDDHVDDRHARRRRRDVHPHPVVARLDAWCRCRVDAHAVLVFRSSAGLFLDHGRVHDLVCRCADDVQRNGV